MNDLRALCVLGLALCLAACGDSSQEPAATTDPAVPEAAATMADAGVATPAERKPCIIIMGWDPWEPYQYEIAGGQVFGLDVDLVSAVARNAGCGLDFRKGSWRGLMRQLREGQIDLLAGATRTAEREEFAWFTEPYRDEEFYLYVSADRFDELEARSLEEVLGRGFRIGVVDDYLYGEEIQQYQDDPVYEDQFVYAAMAETNMSQLLDGEVDGIIEDKFVGASIIRQKNLGSVVRAHPARFGSSPVSLMVSRASVDPQRFESLNRSVRELIDNGAIEKVLAQYRNP